MVDHNFSSLFHSLLFFFHSIPLQSFQVPETVREAYTGVLAKGAAAEAEWNIVFAAYGEKVPR